METKQPDSSQPINPVSSTDPLINKPLKLILIIIGILLASAVFAFAYQSINQPKNVETLPTPVPLESPSPTPDETAGWETYRNGEISITLKYPISNTPVEKFVPLKGGEPTFIVASNFNFDINDIPLCDTNTYEDTPCLNPGKNHGQNENIQSITLDGENAVSFYIIVDNLDGGTDVLHVVQTVGSPRVEMALSIAGMGREKEFSQILSTFRFLEGEEDLESPTP